MNEWVTDAATIVVNLVLGCVLVVVIMRVTARPARTEKVASVVRHRIELRDHLVSLVGEDEAYRLLRLVSARMAKPQSDVIVLKKCIDLAQKDQAARRAAAIQHAPASSPASSEGSAMRFTR